MSWLKWLKSGELYTIAPGESVSAAASRMADHGIGVLVVMDEEKLVGILSERDVIRRVLAERRDPDQTTVGEVCTTDIKTVPEDASLSDCARLINRHGFRHVPVVDADGVPLAMISSRDFLRYAVDELESLVAKAYVEERREELTDPYSLVG